MYSANKPLKGVIIQPTTPSLPWKIRALYFLVPYPEYWQYLFTLSTPQAIYDKTPNLFAAISFDIMNYLLYQMPILQICFHFSLDH